MLLRKLPQWVMFLLCSERGEIDPGTPDEGPQLPEGESEDTGDEPEVSAEAEESDLPEELKPGQNLPPELEKHRAGMHRAYTKRLEALKQEKAELEDLQQRAEVVDKFYNDPQYATQIVQDWARKAGYQLTRAEAQEAAQATAVTAQPQAAYVQAVQQSLPEELQAFAPAIAQATQAAFQQMMQPIVQQTAVQKQQAAAQKQAERDKETQAVLEQLSTEAPGWEEHEDEMIQMLDFLQSDQLKHEKYGSKAKLLYNLATGNAEATNAAAERMRQAARHKGATPQGSQGPRSLADRIVKAETDDEAWTLVAQNALSNHPGLP